MAMGSDTLHLLVPGLLGPMQNLDALHPLPKFPLLERLLSRADKVDVAGEDYESTLLPLWGVDTLQGQDRPTAALRRLGDGGEADERTWMQVSPVHLRADRDRLLLFDVEAFDFTMEEAEGLVSLFNQHFAEIGWQLEAPGVHRWYLSVNEPPAVTTHELSQVSGRNMDLFLPEGEGALNWHSLLNEVQMLFTTAEVNEQRERCGKLPVNGAWFSGIGPLPSIADTPYTYVCADDPLVSGLARMAGIDVRPVQEASVAGQGSGLAVYHALFPAVMRADPFEWSERLGEFERWLPNVEGQKLRLYPCNGAAYEISAKGMRRFWRRKKPLSEFIHA
ncbi:MAG: hypothetical protein ABW074_03350 [Sedimenticola sp.]